MKILLMSDIHGNLTALCTVLKKSQHISGLEACILLGDIIDYGMHSNEVIQVLQSYSFPVLCNIWGNHERAILTGNYRRFSTERGRSCAQYTKSILNANSIRYINEDMIPTGRHEFMVSGKKCLAVHGSIADEYWISIHPGQDLDAYQHYDYVFSGHSHRPHFFEKYYKIDDDRKRNERKVIFINPGSVGQPRNQNNRAHFAIVDIDSEEVFFHKERYDIAKEQQAYTGQVDEFYKTRLELGI